METEEKDNQTNKSSENGKSSKKEKKAKAKGKKKNPIADFLDIIIVFSVLAVMTVLSQTNFLDKLENVLYDALLRTKTEKTCNPNVMMAKIDDYSLEEVGAFPWSRDVYANILIRMRELGTSTAVFDIEFLSPGQVAVDPQELQKLPDKFSESMNSMADVIDSFSASVANGQIPPRYSQEVSNDIINSYLVPGYESLFNTVAGHLVRDNDVYFANAIRYFGNAWLTINSSEVNISVDDEYRNFLYSNFMNYNIDDPEDYINENNLWNYSDQKATKGFGPALPVLMYSAAGAGFANVIIDHDGCRRRVELFHKNDDKYFGQLSFAPLLSYVDSKTLVREKNSLTIKDALIPGEKERRDIKIPLDSHGRMLINWVKDSFTESFKQDSIYFLLDLDNIEDNLIAQLENLATFQLKNEEGHWLSYYEAISYLLNEYYELKSYKETILTGAATVPSRQDPRYDDLFARRAGFFRDCAELSSESYITEIFDRIDQLTNKNDEANVEQMNSLKEAIAQRFKDIEYELNLYNENFEKLQKLYKDAFIVIGNAAAGTTDLGTTPFYGAYPNMGTHANVFNTIITGNFIKPVSWLICYAVAVLLSIGLLAFRALKETKYRNAYGIVAILILPIAAVVAMRFFSIYIPFGFSTLTVILSFVGVFILSAINENKDKKFITSAFGQCLSPAVVEEIVANPDSFKLGGQSLEMTAIFTDIQKFSSFSELLSASQLVALLNYYLTKMSDIILEERGTVDKYEGDAIVAFIGAPLKCEDHAKRAVRSAIKMKKSEIEMNAQILQIAGGEKPEEMDQDQYDAFKIMVENKKTIFTRIGLNSGEMIAGYMGSQGKKNYTMMGNNVNLASRLEGVNKQYSTGGILVSEATYKLLGDGFVCRRLDRVRVVNVNTPIRLYEPLAEKASASPDLLKYVEYWDKTMSVFEAKKYEQALGLFKKLSSHDPDDKVAKYYIGLIEKFFIKGKYPVEADDVGVEYNPEDGVFKLLQK